jgi:hypothetical protein
MTFINEHQKTKMWANEIWITTTPKSTVRENFGLWKWTRRVPLPRRRFRSLPWRFQRLWVSWLRWLRYMCCSDDGSRQTSGSLKFQFQAVRMPKYSKWCMVYNSCDSYTVIQRMSFDQISTDLYYLTWRLHT